MSEISIPEPIRLDPRVVYCPTDNPNRMTPEMYAALLQSIRVQGFVQPVLVVKGGPDEYDYTIVDGEHRTKAMIELNAVWYPAIVAEDASEAKRLIARIGLNRIKGSLDLVDVSRDLDLIMSMQVPLEDMLSTGFPADEVEALLRATEPILPEDILGDIPDSEPPSKVRKSTSKRNLTLKFASEVDRVRAEDALMASSDGTEDPVIGLMALLELEPDVD